MVDGNDKTRRIVKCPGRFQELRSTLYNDAFEIVLKGDTNVTLSALGDCLELLTPDLPRLDVRDPYYHSRVDTLRRNPCQADPLSLVPLIDSTYHINKRLVAQYALSQGNREAVCDKLALMVEHPERFLLGCLGREPKTVVFPDNQTLSGYRVGANFGIGTVCPGGIKGGGVRSDSPYLLELNECYRGESNLAMVVGFWAQDNTMLVSQIQPCGNAHLPKGVQLGVGALHLAEVVARGMGFDRIIAYPSKKHPIFYEHPDSKAQLEAEFACIWDSSAKKLGFNGGRNDCHEKQLR